MMCMTLIALTLDDAAEDSILLAWRTAGQKSQHSGMASHLDQGLLQGRVGTDF